MALSIQKRNLRLEAQYRGKVYAPKALDSMKSKRKKGEAWGEPVGM